MIADLAPLGWIWRLIRHGKSWATNGGTTTSFLRMRRWGPTLFGAMRDRAVTWQNRERRSEVQKPTCWKNNLGVSTLNSNWRIILRRTWATTNEFFAGEHLSCPTLLQDSGWISLIWWTGLRFFLGPGWTTGQRGLDEVPRTRNGEGTGFQNISDNASGARTGVFLFCCADMGQWYRKFSRGLSLCNSTFRADIFHERHHRSKLTLPDASWCSNQRAYQQQCQQSFESKDQPTYDKLLTSYKDNGKIFTNNVATGNHGHSKENQTSWNPWQFCLYSKEHCLPMFAWTQAYAPDNVQYVRIQYAGSGALKSIRQGKCKVFAIQTISQSFRWQSRA